MRWLHSCSEHWCFGQNLRLIGDGILCMDCPDRDSDAAAIAAPCGDMAVPQDQQARPEGIARTTGSGSNENVA
jgi:hypothetical protein